MDKLCNSLSLSVTSNRQQFDISARLSLLRKGELQYSHVCTKLCYTLPARKHHQPCDKEDESEDDKERVTRSRPTGVMEHLSRLSWEKQRYNPFNYYCTHTKTLISLHLFKEPINNQYPYMTKNTIELQLRSKQNRIRIKLLTAALSSCLLILPPLISWSVVITSTMTFTPLLNI